MSFQLISSITGLIRPMDETRKLCEVFDESGQSRILEGMRPDLPIEKFMRSPFRDSGGIARTFSTIARSVPSNRIWSDRSSWRCPSPRIKVARSRHGNSNLVA